MYISIAYFITFFYFINFHDLSRPRTQFHDISMNNANLFLTTVHISGLVCGEGRRLDLKTL